jgi:hypothetical protein
VAHAGETAKRRISRVANERATGDLRDVFMAVFLIAEW